MSQTFLSSCKKLKQGQLLMQRYNYVWNRYGGHPKYGARAQVVKDKSVELAKRMKAHSAECQWCSVQDENYYGLDYVTW
jgi:hypothetical protein